MSEKVKTKFSNKISNSILGILKTKENANQFTELVKFLSGKTFSTEEFDIDKVVANRYGDKVPFWLKDIKRELVGSNDLESIRSCLLELESVVDNAPLVRVEISFTPSRDFVSSLYEIVGKMRVSGISKDSFLIDFEVNTALVGGAKLHIGGKYVDLSLKKILVNYLETNDVIKRYL
jgi:F0F1-type ATP synthase delta subunit